MLFQYYKCEQKKFLYQKWNLVVLIGILVFVPVMALTIDSFTGGTEDMINKSKLIQGFYLGQAGYAVLTALYFGNEYQRSALRTSLLSTPKRELFFSLLVSLLFTCVSNTVTCKYSLFN